MAGIWEIVKGNVADNVHRINIGLLQTELMGVTLGLRTMLKAKENLESELHRVLSAAESTDLSAIAASYSVGDSQDKLIFNERVKFCLNAAELNLIDETEFRSQLGI